MRIKIHNFSMENSLDLKGTVWIGKIKQVRHATYVVDVCAANEDAGDFDEDDYMIECCRGWFGKDNVEICE